MSKKTRQPGEPKEIGHRPGRRPKTWKEKNTLERTVWVLGWLIPSGIKNNLENDRQLKKLEREKKIKKALPVMKKAIKKMKDQFSK